MTRWLTPAKVGLLALIELYIDGHVPNAAIIPVLSFITSYLIDHDFAISDPSTSSRWTKAERAASLVRTPQDFEKLLSPWPVVIGFPGRNLWDTFLDKLWDINSLHSLHAFFGRQDQALAKTKEQLRRLGGQDPHLGGIRLTRNSPFGAFVRRSQLEFFKLRFHDTAELWTEFVKYRQPTIAHRRRRNPTASWMSFDSVLESWGQDTWDPEGVQFLTSVTHGNILTNPPPPSVLVSKDDIELLLEFQIEQMQKHGNRVPVEIRNQFLEILSESFTIPSLAHYLSFLDAWRSGDYPTSFDYLHRYFDYTVQNRDRLFYQYALMNLAVLQADFGCHQDAVATMLETVSTARENRDMICLNFSLNWLFHYGRAHPKLIRSLETDSVLGTGKESLAYLRVKARETGMWTLWSSVLLSEAKLGLANGESVATSMELMIRSSHLILDCSMRNMFGAQLSISMALWDRLGLAQISAAESEVFLRCHARHSVFDDILKVTCRVAMQLTERGHYDEALRRLEDADDNSLRAWKPSQYWHRYRGIIKLTRDLRHSNLNGAEQLLSQLLQSKSDDLESDTSFAIDSLHIGYLIRRGDLSAAFEKVEDMLADLQDNQQDVQLRLQLMLTKVHLFDKAGLPQKGFTLAMRAASLAWRARLVANLWQAVGALANVLSSLGEFGPAARLLTAVLPRSLECDSASLSGTLFSHLADANMGLAGKAPRGSPRRMEYLTRAVGSIEKAFGCFSDIDDVDKQCEMMAKKATIMKVGGEKGLAADYAAAYVSLKHNAAVFTM